jgi:hypothetical protein
VPAVPVVLLACAVAEGAGGAVAGAGVGEQGVRVEECMRSQIRSTSVCGLLVVLLAAFLYAGAVHGQAQPGPRESAPSASRAFNTPQQAAEALISAAGNYDVSSLLEIFGPEGKDFVSSSDPIRDRSIAADFAAKARERNRVTIDPKDKARAVVSVGNDDWPFPVPIVKRGSKWFFDSKQGHDEILLRRIGANELDAIQVCRGFVDAQKEYSSEIHDNSGINQYAQKIISTPGKHDGLYWQNDDGTPGGPVSEAVARAIEEGYSPGKSSGYHGYYFKVLKGQGPAARLGRLDYVVEGVMIGGFALVAFPAEYRVTGVKSFMVSYDGIVYQKDLGSDTLNVAQNMERYNPDKTWQRTDDEWPADPSVASN